MTDTLEMEWGGVDVISGRGAVGRRQRRHAAAGLGCVVLGGMMLAGGASRLVEHPGGATKGGVVGDRKAARGSTEMDGS